MPRSTTSHPPDPWLKPAVLCGALVPLAAIAGEAVAGRLGANPIAEALNRLGLLALIFLIASLACSPVRTVLDQTWPIRLRRMLGLCCFFFALLHVVTYVALDQQGDWRAIWADVTKRKFTFVGFAAFALLVPLAATSTAAAVRRMGFRRWKRLHRLAYVAGVLGVIHFLWRVKLDVSEPVAYAAVLAVLLLARVAASRRGRCAGQGAADCSRSNAARADASPGASRSVSR